MKIIAGGEKFQLNNSHPFAKAILTIARAYASQPGAVPLPERNDVKQLWRELRPAHKKFLREIAKQPGGVAQADLAQVLGVSWTGLRGVHNGLARICEGVGIDKPVRVVGYNAGNRRYLMDPDAAKTVGNLSKLKLKMP
jgi:hypothetical protein